MTVKINEHTKNWIEENRGATSRTKFLEMILIGTNVEFTKDGIPRIEGATYDNSKK